MTSKNVIHIRQVAGDWTATPQPPLAAATDLITSGWDEVVKLRKDYEAVHHFPVTADHDDFVKRFGPDPWADEDEA